MLCKEKQPVTLYIEESEGDAPGRVVSDLPVVVGSALLSAAAPAFAEPGKRQTKTSQKITMSILFFC